MGHYSFHWPGMDPTAMPGGLPLPAQVAATNGGAYFVDPSMYSSILPGMLTPVPPASMEAEAARRRQEEAENSAIRMVHLLVTCAAAIMAGDYAAAAGSLHDARAILATISITVGIGRVTSYFSAALSQRLFPAFEHPSLLPPLVPAKAELYRHFYEATGPYLRFAHFTANQAIVDAFEGYDRVHIVDLALMHGLQWPSLIRALALRPGGPPALRITGVGPPRTDGRDELREVGIRLAEVARTANVPFSFRGVTGDQLDGLQPWMFQIATGEAVAVNSILQLHRLLVDPDAASTSLPAPINVVLDWVASMQPKVFTVVEQEADHNRPSLVERFTNALFYYAAMFDSIEAVSRICPTAGGGGALADGYIQSEIFDIVCGEGSGRAERHEPLPRWRERLGRAGLVQVPLGQGGIFQAASLLRSYDGAGYCVHDHAGCLTLGWHDQPLLSASAWRAPPPPPSPPGAEIDAAGASTVIEDRKGKFRKISSESSGSGSGSGNGAVGGAFME